MPLLVRVRPNAVYLLVLLVAAVLMIQSFRGGDVLGTILGCAMGVMLIVIASPIVRSTLLGTPALAITPDGLSCPLMGLYLRWDEIAVIRRSVGPLQRPLLLIIPTAPDAVIRQVRPWLRRDVRRNLARYGAPLALADSIWDHSLDDILAALRRYHAPLDE
jgi:hypothetical protein